MGYDIFFGDYDELGYVVLEIMMGWGHVAGGQTNAHLIFVGEHIGKRLLGRSRRWEDTVKIVLGETGCEGRR
jgi:hypothetical protein